MNLKNQRRRWLLLPVASTLLAAGAVSAVYAATEAGQTIKNRATVTYEDAAGNVYSAQSNEAVVTVAQVYSASIGSDSALSASPGQPVYLSYSLENTGNGSDIFDLLATDDNSTLDDLNADSITIYHDVNGDGQPTSGEPEITGSFSLDPGSPMSIVVEVQVPSTALANETLGITLLAEAEEGTGTLVPDSVVDITASKGLDGEDGTVESTITVSADAVVVATKSATHNAAANEITYTLTINNNGNAPASTVNINDAFPLNTTYVPASATAAGLLVSNGDTLPFLVNLDETTDGVDYNGDGDQLDASVPGLSASDLILPPNTTLSVTYKVSYDPAVVTGGSVISNTAYVFPDQDNDGAIDGPVPTNPVFTIIDSEYGVAIADTGENTTGDQINDGQDDDALNQFQLVDQVAAGETVVFKAEVTNTGNTRDILELSIANSSGAPFPTGTVFTFWDETNSVQLADTNAIFGVDVGEVDPNVTETVTIRAQLPASISGAGNYDAFVTVTSAGRPDQTASMTARLELIVAPAVDIHNDATGTLAANEDLLGTPDYVAVDTIVANVGDTLTFPVYIDNEGGVATSYQLGAGGSFDDVNGVLGGLPAGWNVEFFLSDGAGAPTGSAVTSTPIIPANTTNYEIFVVVSVPSDQTQALFNYVADNDADGTDETLDENADSDGDYPLFLEVTSSATGATDTMLKAIDVNTVHALTLTPSGSEQVEVGGTVSFPHTLANNGNADAVVELSATNSQGGWSNTVSIDTDGDGAADTEIGNLTPGTITVRQPDGSTETVTVTVPAGSPILTIPTGTVVPLSATVFAPSSASVDDVDTLTITAINSASGLTTTVQDQSQIVEGNVRLTKTVAVDNECDGIENTIFMESQAVQVEPGQCLIWQVVAENQGTADAYKVVITDPVPPFTTYEAGSLMYCVNTGCTLATSTDGTGDDAGEEDAGTVTFYIGTDAVPGTGTGGTLVPGDQATVRFSVLVD
jgi:uncharacterized repeat protein (TIGR01451 family)